MANKYFFKLQMSLSHKNKMDEEINQFLNSLDATLINSSIDLKIFKAKIKLKVKEIHDAHPRCKPIELSIWSFSKIDRAVRCGCTSGTIYNVKIEFQTTNK